MKVYTPVYLCMKIIVCLVILITLTGTLTAGEIDQATLKISIQDPQIRYYRYQFNGERASKWTTTTTEQPVMTFGHEELRENTLHLQQSYTGKAWSPTSKYIYVEASNTWIKVQEAQTKSTLSLDAETHANLPLGVYQEYYQRGIGGKVQLNKAWSNNITSGASFSYTYGVSKTSRVNDFHKLQLIGVVGYELPILKAVSLIPELGLGALLHMPVGTVFVNGTAGVHYFVDFVAEAGLKVTLHIGPIIQIYTAPRFKLFAEANSVGMLGELAIGTTVAL